MAASSGRPVLKGCLIALGAILVLLLVATAVVGPGIYREGRKFVGPIVAMGQSGKRLQAYSQAHPYKHPADDRIDPERLMRFLDIRRKVDELYSGLLPELQAIPRGQSQDYHDAQKALATMQKLIPARIQIFLDAEMTPAEYHDLERVVYGTWLPALHGMEGRQEERLLAAREIRRLAGGEKDEAVAKKLEALARDLIQSELQPPAGLSAETHQLLLSHLDEIEQYSLSAYQDLAIPPAP